VILDGVAYLSVQGPRNPDGKPLSGQVPGDRSAEEAVAAARNVGRGARSAVGMSSLPSNVAVEVEMTVKLKDG
jgi:enamine deaminase RidA (YjgF/YER057c/UK114 family)